MNDDNALDVHRRWLPPPEHLARLQEVIRVGLATIEDRGHGKPPLVLFEDGGAIELPRVRYRETHRGMELASDETPSSCDTTMHRDVCGCVDEIKGLLRDDPSSFVTDPAHFRRLIEDALYMIGRMHGRLSAYSDFAADLARLASAAPETLDTTPAGLAADEFLGILDAGEGPDVESLGALAEQIRDVASRQEQCLEAGKQIARAVHRLYLAIKGGRVWEDKPPAP